MNQRLGFGVFLAPHHPIGEHPTLQYERDLELAEWLELHDGALQIRPLQERIPIAVASTISPSGMKTAGKYGVGVLSIASYSEEGLQALPTQWKFGETSAREHGNALDRRHWRIVIP